MGDWHISIDGVGAHHNKDFPNDADKMVDRFLDDLVAAGHDIKAATITYGGRQVYDLGAKKADHYEKLGEGRPRPPQDELERIWAYIKTLRKQKTFLE